MKIQYTFTADLEDVQEILFQKYSRIYSRNDLIELHISRTCCSEPWNR